MPPDLQDTEVLTARPRRPAPPPDALRVCSTCFAVADGADLTGWLTATGPGSAFAYGVCPGCRVVESEPPAGG